MLYDNLTSALHGRIWDGKEKLLEAVSALLRSVGKIMTSKWEEATIKTVHLLLQVHVYNNFWYKIDCSMKRDTIMRLVRKNF